MREGPGEGTTGDDAGGVEAEDDVREGPGEGMADEDASRTGPPECSRTASEGC